MLGFVSNFGQIESQDFSGSGLARSYHLLSFFGGLNLRISQDLPVDNICRLETPKPTHRGHDLGCNLPCLLFMSDFVIKFSKHGHRNGQALLQ